MNLTRTSIELVPTITTGEIWKALDITKKRAFFTLIFGGTGRGKTLTATHWAAQNSATMVRCRTSSSRPKLLRQLSMSVTGVIGSDASDREERIIDTLLKTDRHTIIIDEANHLLRTASTMTRSNSMDFLRDIYDEMREVHDKPIGMALIFTSYTFNEFKHGPLAGFLEQFSGRMMHHVQIPDKIFVKREILPILKKYVADPDEKLLKAAYDIASGANGKIRTLVKYLDLAKEYVTDHKGSINAALLENLRARYENGGAWPEDNETEE